MSVVLTITIDAPASYEFACHSKACAPPPAGKGGSLRVSGPFNDYNGTHKMILTKNGVVQHVGKLTKEQVDNFDPEAEWRKAASKPINIRR